MEESWKECIENCEAFKAEPSIAKAKSFVEVAEARLKFIGKIGIDECNASFVFEQHYASALEYIHALVALGGFKVYNNICLGLYLRDVLNKKKMFRIFESCRKDINALAYHGQMIDLQRAGLQISYIMQFVKEVRDIIYCALKKGKL